MCAKKKMIAKAKADSEEVRASVIDEEEEVAIKAIANEEIALRKMDEELESLYETKHLEMELHELRELVKNMKREQDDDMEARDEIDETPCPNPKSSECSNLEQLTSSHKKATNVTVQARRADMALSKQTSHQGELLSVKPILKLVLAKEKQGSKRSAPDILEPDIPPKRPARSSKRLQGGVQTPDESPTQEKRGTKRPQDDLLEIETTPKKMRRATEQPLEDGQMQGNTDCYRATSTSSAPRLKLCVKSPRKRIQQIKEILRAKKWASTKTFEPELEVENKPATIAAPLSAKCLALKVREESPASTVTAEFPACDSRPASRSSESSFTMEDAPVPYECTSTERWFDGHWIPAIQYPVLQATRKREEEKRQAAARRAEREAAMELQERDPMDEVCESSQLSVRFYDPLKPAERARVQVAMSQIMERERMQNRKFAETELTVRGKQNSRNTAESEKTPGQESAKSVRFSLAKGQRRPGSSSDESNHDSGIEVNSYDAPAQKGLSQTEQDEIDRLFEEGDDECHDDEGLDGML